jgi:hypothetical protein
VEEELSGPALDEAQAVVPARVALRSGTSTAADEIDGYCENGVGVYLSAAGDSAELTLYLVPPATRATFEHPALRLSVAQPEGAITDRHEFESVTLQVGESRVLSRQAQGKLMAAAAELTVQ